MGVDIHGRLYVGVPEKFFLHSQVRPHVVDQRGKRVPERVPPNSANASLFRGWLDMIGEEDASPARPACISCEHKVCRGLISRGLFVA